MLCRLGIELDITPWRDCWPQTKHDQASSTAALAPSSLYQPVNDAEDPPADASASCCDVNASAELGASLYPTPDSVDSLEGLGSASGVDSGHAVSHPAVTCQEFIEELRRSRFGIGMDLPEDIAGYVHQQEVFVQQLSQALSDGLYSKNLHFVLELLQNTDDSAFASGVTPTVEFILEADYITVYTNEVLSHCG